MTLRYRWTGREWDAETGWYFHRARYYDPGQRRFVQEDPAGVAGGENLYAYVGGRPLVAADPSGLGPDPKFTQWPSDCCAASHAGWDGWFGISGTLLETTQIFVAATGEYLGSWNMSVRAAQRRMEAWSGGPGRVRWFGPTGDEGQCVNEPTCNLWVMKLVSEGVDVTIVRLTLDNEPGWNTGGAADLFVAYNPSQFSAHAVALFNAGTLTAPVIDIASVITHELAEGYFLWIRGSTQSFAYQQGVDFENLVRNSNPSYYGIRTRH
ncbi:MAG: RHS repeat-associated core domain-containing protein [Gemmatimonadetes bacterium]|nr:RHS repeat-associated core domain-containing protein [Gemmatimonadota bacterium]MBK9692173.1 RHS repeat-associated core domain-containing protein [Gemmatimonadota bacterium]